MHTKNTVLICIILIQRVETILNSPFKSSVVLRKTNATNEKQTTPDLIRPYRSYKKRKGNEKQARPERKGDAIGTKRKRKG